MERQPGRLIEQLQIVQARQRRVIQQLQAENVRRLADLSDVRLERDGFREEAARARKENAELRNQLEEILTEYRDIKRERAALARALVSPTVRGHVTMYGRGAHLGLKMLNTLSVLSEEQLESPQTAETSITATAGRPGPEPGYLYRGLPDPLKTDSPRPDPASDLVTVHKDPRIVPMIQTTNLCRGDSPVLPCDTAIASGGRSVSATFK